MERVNMSLRCVDCNYWCGVPFEEEYSQCWRGKHPKKWSYWEDSEEDWKYANECSSYDDDYTKKDDLDWNPLTRFM